MAQHVLVLNATYEPLNVCSLRRACVLLLKEKAEIIERLERPLRTASTTFPLPRRDPARGVRPRAPRHFARRITRKAVFARDEYRCQYCGGGGRLTVDHVVPRSRGGGSSWDNIVTSCAPCNLRKADRLPHEIGMTPRTRPRPPAPGVFITLCGTRGAAGVAGLPHALTALRASSCARPSCAQPALFDSGDGESWSGVRELTAVDAARAAALAEEESGRRAPSGVAVPVMEAP